LGEEVVELVFCWEFDSYWLSWSANLRYGLPPPRKSRPANLPCPWKHPQHLTQQDWGHGPQIL